MIIIFMIIEKVIIIFMIKVIYKRYRGGFYISLLHLEPSVFFWSHL